MEEYQGRTVGMAGWPTRVQGNGPTGVAGGGSQGDPVQWRGSPGDSPDDGSGR